MLTVSIPNKFRQEIEYTFDVLLNTFLGVKYILKTHAENDFVVSLSNNNKLIISNDFFSQFNEQNGYLNKRNIPEKPIFVQCKFSIENDVPVIFGDKSIEISQDQIYCGPDIIASSFFMLTRWEEYCIKEKDQFGNFPSSLSFMQRNGLSHRPIVNEYVELLWNMLVYLGIKDERKHRQYSVKITHDIDNFARYNTSLKYIKALGGDLMLRKNPGLLLKTTSDFLKVRSDKMKDPYDTFDFFMDVSEEYGLKSHFYFIPGIKGEEDFRYSINDIKVIRTINNIVNRGHKVGIHGSLSSFNNIDQFSKELGRLQNLFPDIQGGRQHYLKFENPVTWQMWNDLDLQYDSTMGFENDGGFRSGVCYSYPVFNIISRKSLQLIEQPLIVMEGSLILKYPDFSDFKLKLIELAETVKKYNGTFVFLWHNNNINSFEWKGLGRKYAEIVNSIV
ncbi:MAG: polysaccharide deacetylase family protein [Bacteroidales bacterium]|nr:polysaccharide deacetylase family protein [Bacteroidales bacterium]